MKSASAGIALLMSLAGISAAQIPPTAMPDLLRGVAAVAARNSAAPALRAERAGTPSAAFTAGATLDAWRNASAGLANDAAHPLGDGGEVATLRGDCFDEKTAFAALETAGAHLGTGPVELVRAAGLSGEVAAAWIARRSAAPAACR